jgi:hypothetical protein
MPCTRMRRLLKTALLPICTMSIACDKGIPTETISASLSNSETFRYATVGGDEEGARIATRPRHALISEIHRGAETNWVATYVYQPMPGYIGSDYAQLEILTGSDGASPPNIRMIVIAFAIHQ